MAKLTKPQDLQPRASEVDKIISAIEAKLMVDRRFNSSDSKKKTVEIDGDFDSSDRLEVCKKYKEVGWWDVTHKRSTRGITRVTIFTFTTK